MICGALLCGWELTLMRSLTPPNFSLNSCSSFRLASRWKPSQLISEETAPKCRCFQIRRERAGDERARSPGRYVPHRGRRTAGTVLTGLPLTIKNTSITRLSFPAVSLRFNFPIIASLGACGISGPRIISTSTAVSLRLARSLLPSVRLCGLHKWGPPNCCATCNASATIDGRHRGHSLIGNAYRAGSTANRAGSIVKRITGHTGDIDPSRAVSASGKEYRTRARVVAGAQ